MMRHRFIFILAILCLLLTQGILAADSKAKKSSLIYERRIPDSLLINKAVEFSNDQLVAIAMDFLRTQKSNLGIDDVEQKLGTTKIHKAAQLQFADVIFKQIYHRIPVPTGNLVVRVNPDGIVIRIISHLIQDIDINVNPAIDIQQAIDIALEANAGSCDTSIAKPPRLLVYEPYYGAELVLAYEIVVRCKNHLQGWYYYIDAHNGNIIYKRDVTIQ